MFRFAALQTEIIVFSFWWALIENITFSRSELPLLCSGLTWGSVNQGPLFDYSLHALASSEASSLFAQNHGSHKISALAECSSAEEALKHLWLKEPQRQVVWKVLNYLITFVELSLTKQITYDKIDLPFFLNQNQCDILLKLQWKRVHGQSRRRAVEPSAWALRFQTTTNEWLCLSATSWSASKHSQLGAAYQQWHFPIKVWVYIVLAQVQPKLSLTSPCEVRTYYGNKYFKSYVQFTVYIVFLLTWRFCIT